MAIHCRAAKNSLRGTTIYILQRANFKFRKQGRSVSDQPLNEHTGHNICGNNRTGNKWSAYREQESRKQMVCTQGTNGQHTGNNRTGNKWSAYREQQYREKMVSIQGTTVQGTNGLHIQGTKFQGKGCMDKSTMKNITEKGKKRETFIFFIHSFFVITADIFSKWFVYNVQ